ncbi:MAG: TIGR04086 family membrane protein [Firmicutes bacterium]|nr:TIGR04086 family membrane protein [Bacillota bacterium]
MAKEMTPAARRSARSHSVALGPLVGIARGLLAAAAVTVLGVVVFALLIRWTNPSDTVISVMNQALKLGAIFTGCRACIGRGGTGGVFKGALTGLLYMMLGIIGYAFLSGLSLSSAAYLTDLGMGVAAGGLCGMIMSNLPKK